MGNKNGGCTLSSLYFLGLFALMFLGLLIGISKSCERSHSNKPQSQTEIKNPYQGQIDKQEREDERYHRCKNCHGKGTVLFSPNSWGGPGFCNICNKEVSGEHPHICEKCKGTGKEGYDEKTSSLNNSQSQPRKRPQSLARGVPCKKCQGKGHFDIHTGNEHFQLTCPECNGTGDVW